jgi:hypothetical protein
MRAIMLTLAVAVAGATLALPTVPAIAGTEACEVAPAKLRTMAASAEASAQKKALRNVDLGVALCDARNRAEAAKKFNLAAKALGTDLAAVMTTETASAQ